MPDTEDKEKAEKLAAAKKRYEQLKKQKGKKGPTKAGAAESAPPEPEEKPKDEAPVSSDKVVEDSAEESTAIESSKPAESQPTHGRGPSISLQSKMRSESFRKSSGPLSPSIKSPTLPSIGSDGDSMQEIYRKQAQRLEELEKHNKILLEEKNKMVEYIDQLEAELDSESVRKNYASLEEKYQNVSNLEETLKGLRSELEAVKRQNVQLQSAASRRRRSTSSPGISNANADLEAQLASKSNTIESLELELSKLRNQLTTTQSTNDSHVSRIAALETQLEKANHSADSTAKELADLKKNLERASERAVAEGSSRSSAETRLAQVEAELGTAKRAADEATRRAEILEKKIETLTTLRRESDARSQAKVAEMQKQDREAKELRARVTALGNENARLRDEAVRRRKLEAEGDVAGLEELEDEERLKMQSRIRALEEEVFELRRGVWREKRRDLQLGLDDGAGGFDDVDLSASSSSPFRSHAQSGGQRGSTFQDVINSGISAFTGGNRRASISSGAKLSHPPRKQSLGLLSEDDDQFEFDEEAFRLAQEEEAKNRIERIKEVKRGLKKWDGWRCDLVDVRSTMGGVFEI